ncbi:MAG TPA: hypothetical protein VJZ71_17430 [Phycisphaerae bacterium]|nr:hypothetical protein [Phycisphaerae bacterium]
MNQEQPKPDPRTGFRNFVSIFVFLARTFAVSVEVFLHRSETFGDRYLELQAAAALLLMFFWPAFCEPVHDPEPMLVFLGLYILACLAVRIEVFRRIRRGGPQPHSRYTGTPALMKFMRRTSEIKVKCAVEPLLTFALGGALLAASPPLGGYLMLASAGLLISTNLTANQERQRVRDMNDAYMEQRHVVDRFRDLRGD